MGLAVNVARELLKHNEFEGIRNTRVGIKMLRNKLRVTFPYQQDYIVSPVIRQLEAWACSNCRGFCYAAYDNHDYEYDHATHTKLGVARFYFELHEEAVAFKIRFAGADLG